MNDLKHPRIDPPQDVKQCSECQHVFTAGELAKEKPEDWGHPCFVTAKKRPIQCESYRQAVQILAAGHPTASGRKQNRSEE